jgi:hypothetical protein
MEALLTLLRLFLPCAGYRARTRPRPHQPGRFAAGLVPPKVHCKCTVHLLGGPGEHDGAPCRARLYEFQPVLPAKLRDAVQVFLRGAKVAANSSRETLFCPGGLPVQSARRGKDGAPCLLRTRILTEGTSFGSAGPVLRASRPGVRSVPLIARNLRIGQEAQHALLAGTQAQQEIVTGAPLLTAPALVVPLCGRAGKRGLSLMEGEPLFQDAVVRSIK